MDEKKRSSYGGGVKGRFDDTNTAPEVLLPVYDQLTSNYNTHATLTPSVSGFRTTFASLSLHMTDRIRLLRFPETDVFRVQDIVRTSWPRGIQELRQYDQSNEIKLYGNPWSSRSGNQRIEARRLVMGLMQGLFDMGWVLKAAVDISKKEFDKDSLLFRHQQPPPPPCMWMCISFDKGDLMHLIDAPTNLSRSLVKALGQKVQRSEMQGSVYEIKFNGYPWRASGTDTVQTRVILLILLETLEEHGFSLYASIDQDNGPGGDSHATEADTWFCNRQADWTPGAPIYHA